MPVGEQFISLDSFTQPVLLGTPSKESSWNLSLSKNPTAAKTWNIDPQVHSYGWWKKRQTASCIHTFQEGHNWMKVRSNATLCVIICSLSVALLAAVMLDGYLFLWSLATSHKHPQTFINHHTQQQLIFYMSRKSYTSAGFFFCLHGDKTQLTRKGKHEDTAKNVLSLHRKHLLITDWLSNKWSISRFPPSKTFLLFLCPCGYILRGSFTLPHFSLQVKKKKNYKSSQY